MVTIGKLVRTQGNRGELKLNLYHEHLSKPFFQKVYLQRKRSLEEFEVESFRPYKDHYLIKLKAVNTLSQARELAGLDVLVPEEWLRPLTKNNYYLFQLRGCSVLTKDKRKIGTVKDFLFIEENDLLVVKKGRREILIPFTQSICTELNLKKREIMIDPPDGLLELNEI